MNDFFENTIYKIYNILKIKLLQIKFKIIPHKRLLGIRFLSGIIAKRSLIQERFFNDIQPG